MRKNKIVALMGSVFVKKNNKKLDIRYIMLYISVIRQINSAVECLICNEDVVGSTPSSGSGLSYSGHYIALALRLPQFDSE